MTNQKRYATYKEFDAEYKFAEKAGFQLSELQIKDTETFTTWGRSLCRAEVGGGKTVMSTVTSLMKGADVTVVAVPPILQRPWVRWLEKVSERVIAYTGNPKQRKELRAKLPQARWIVVSHAIFRKDKKYITEAVQGRDYELILDEAQAAMNIDSKLFQIVCDFTYGRGLQLLTATPANSPKHYFSYIHLVTPNLYRGWDHFCNLHYGEKDFFGAVKEYRNLDLLNENFAKRSIARTKEELHGYNNAPLFPDSSYQLEPEHQELYEQLIEERLLELEDGTKIDATIAQKLYHMSQQIVVNWGHFAGDNSKRSAAYDLVDMTIEQTDCLRVGKSKLIIWTMYQMTSKAMMAYLQGLGIKVVGAFGGMKSQDSFDKFMDDPEVRIGVFQPQSAGAGLNPQSVCWESLFIETSTVPIYNRQAIGRVDRMGQMHKPTIRIGMAEGTIQVALFNQLMKNADIVDHIEGSKTKLRDLLLGR